MNDVKDRQVLEIFKNAQVELTNNESHRSKCSLLKKGNLYFDNYLNMLMKCNESYSSLRIQT